MNFPWAICLAPEDSAALAALRLAPGVEVGEKGGLIWLRGRPLPETLQAQVAALPGQVRYEWLANNQLRRIDRRIPEAAFPRIQWQSLAAWLQAALPVAALPAIPPEPVPLRLVRCETERAAELILTTLDDLSQFAATAAQIRLERLHFAANEDGAVLVRGQPLPPVPGQRFVLYGAIAVPAGFSWQPAVSPEVLLRRFRVAEGALAVWREDGRLVRLHTEQFVPVSRGALRATAQARAEHHER